MVHDELRLQLPPLEDRIRRMGGERSYAIGAAIGAALLRLSRGASSRRRHGAAKGRAHTLGRGVAAGD